MDTPNTTNTEGNNEEMTLTSVAAILSGEGERPSDEQVGQLANFLRARATENTTTPMEEARDMGLYDPELEVRLTEALDSKTAESK